MASLNDGRGDYLSATGELLASGLELILDRNVERTGPDGCFVSVPVAIAWRKAELPGVARGGRFLVGAQAFVVEAVIGDDGHLLTAACLEAP